MNPSEWIDQLIEGISDWRGKTLAAVRKAILSADKGITEEWKWKGSPCWFRDGGTENRAGGRACRCRADRRMRGSHRPLSAASRTRHK